MYDRKPLMMPIRRWRWQQYRYNTKVLGPSAGQTGRIAAYTRITSGNSEEDGRYSLVKITKNRKVIVAFYNMFNKYIEITE